ncbi:hypothetical protein SARC_13219 [Sphaeroforma arctica JP610]|uniref:Cupin type-1 domain-containing protein n=1 Tax=Sphaeroforma arctica JP610 TaxID=667725 RepID=A0A0L0FDT9_9EUKA|nr:hypothetical protein SARC_13219 [Sphaeroforma arctica JP610]KNC74228.1 hypothetical protein SARC_13219 [Sphaeroforma arctica JP610]|eukprot:XP_014148130.1 hypothetical protein SARC_13219 [Sphaeroforma arctica JP610]
MSLARTIIAIAALALTTTSVEGRSSGQICKYRGNTYAESEHAVGTTLTCTCSEGRWVNCEENMNSNNSGDDDTGNSSVNGAQLGFNDFLNNFDARDFVIDYSTLPGATELGGTVQAANRNNVPVMQAAKMTHTRFHIAPCGINLPHIHPRGTESIYIIEGALTVGFVTESGRLITNDVIVDQSTFFPRGLIHYQQNMGCEPAGYISMLDDSDAGLLVVSGVLGNLPSEALEATFDEDAEFVNQLLMGLPTGPARGRAECFVRCGLSSNVPF